MPRDFLILFLLPVVSMPQRENSLSMNACEAGAEIRSRATSGMTEPLSCCRQNSAGVQEFAPLCWADPSCTVPGSSSLCCWKRAQLHLPDVEMQTRGSAIVVQ